MEGRTRVLSPANGSLKPLALFIGEAPGRLGADHSAIPFHGDVAGNNFEALLAEAGIDRNRVFVTNAVLCNPRDENGNNSTPVQSEIKNCSNHLISQIDLLSPSVVVTLGAKALAAVSIIEEHNMQLSSDVGTPKEWYGRRLVALYHPGQRAMLRRPYPVQVDDYRKIATLIRALPCYVVQPIELARRILLHARAPLSYFALHKLFYLAEVRFHEMNGYRLTNAYIIRQNNGPYVTDIHFSKLQKFVAGVRLYRRNSDLLVALGAANSNLQVSLWPGSGDPESLNGFLPDTVDYFVRDLIKRYGSLSDSDLKVKAYLTRPMKRILREEAAKGRSLNRPIFIA